MNDLADLKWEGNSSNPQSSLAPSAPNYSSLRPASTNISRQSTPNSAAHSGRSTPLSALNSANKPPGQDASAGKTNGGDSFANLLPTKKNTGQLSMQERQKQLIEERARQAAEQQKRHNEQFKMDDNRFWEEFGKSSGRSTPALNGQIAARAQQDGSNDDADDILAAFNSSAPVDSSSHFPPSDQSETRLSGQGSSPSSFNSHQVKTQALPLDEDDDPFGLGQMPELKNASQGSRQQFQEPLGASEDDDILGDLGRPISERSQPPPTSRSPAQAVETVHLKESSSGPRDRAIAELVDMGFSVEQSRNALDHTGTGMDVQAAVGWLINQAHEESRTKTQSEPRRATQVEQQEQNVLAEDRHGYLERKGDRSRNDSKSPSNIDRDVTQRASEIGSSLFKSANSFWRQGQIRMQKAMAEFQREGDSSQPRWLQETQISQPSAQTASKGGDTATDEALMLDMHKPAAPPRSSRTRTSGEDQPLPPQPRRQQPQPRQQTHELPSRPASRPIEKLSRRAVEEETAQAYISPARRKKAQHSQPSQPQEDSLPTPSKEPTTGLDIFSDTQPTPQPPRPSSATKSPPLPTTKRTVTPALRTKVPARSIPQVSPTALAQSNTRRIEGTAAFKRGDYASAHISYSSAITPLPAGHPILAILYSNRSLTSLKTGDPKAAISDADTALNLIGPSRGEDEIISLGEGEPDKPMKEFYGKALMRKAEALEHLEKWNDAANAWREAVETGFGGPISIQGRNRCEKAAGLAPSTSATTSGRPSPAPASSESAKKPPPARLAPKPRSAALDLASSKESEAVTRLRAANAAAAAASDEAFALSDSVEARLHAWKDGKEGNLRGLLASLDTVLWNGAGWTKVGMGDLVMPNRCKVVYMKAIAKCHPDKIPSDASVEQRMISASVFATLNEAWDRFKVDNGL